MITKEDILSKTQDGLAVFRHFIPGKWTLGKNFKNPYYDDKKASCNVYFDVKSNQYKIKDFGDTRYQGDCFAFVAQINELDVANWADFQEVLRIIVQSLDLEVSAEDSANFPKLNFIPMHFNPSIQMAQIPDATEYKRKALEDTIPDYEIKTQPWTPNQLSYWQKYGIHADILKKYDVVSVLQFTATSKKPSSENKTYTIFQSEQEPIFGYYHKNFVKIYRPFSSLRFQFLGIKPEIYIFGLDHLPARGDILLITGGEKDVLSLAAHGFSAICFNSESASIPTEIIKKLSYRFRHIVLLYDVDKAGLEAVIHHQNYLKEFDVKALQLPLSGSKQEKDISDFFKLGKGADDLKILFHQLLENLYTQTFAMLKSCEIDFKNPPATPEPLITIEGVTIGSPGNLLGITGSEGSGKSNFLGGMVAGALADDSHFVGDSLGTRVSTNVKKKAVLYFDTEQSEDQLYRNLQIVLKRCQRTNPPDWFKAYCLTNLSRRERLQVILQSVDKFHHQFGGIHLVVIDGIGDLIGSLNDERESISLVEELHRMAGIYQTCVLCVLHLVPNGIKLRGHLGSELQRKSSGILCIEKDDHTDVSCVKALKVRCGSPLDVPLVQFAWDRDKGYHVYVGEKSKDLKQQRKINDLTSLAIDIFKENEIVSYTTLTRALSETMGVKARMAKNYINFMLDNGIIEPSKNSKNLRLCEGVFS